MTKSSVAQSGDSNFTTAIRLAVLAGVTVCSAAMVSAALAHPPAVKAACKTDYYKFCPSYKLDTPQLKACIRSAGGNLSTKCIDALADAGEIARKYHSSNRKK